MTTVTETTVTETTVTETTAVAAPAAPRAPSKKSMALAIFATALAARAAGAFASNKAFRANVLAQIQADLGVTVASAATMYNTAKKEAEAADAEVHLGRDPKKERPAKAEGAKRGRPLGSKNRPKAPAAEAPAAEAPAAEAPAAEAPAELVLPQPELVLPVDAEAELAPTAEVQPEAVA